MCRYSEFFRVREGLVRLPDFGLKLGELTEGDRTALSKAFGTSVEGRDVFLFRLNGGAPTLYLSQEGDPFRIRGDARLENVLPTIIKIDARVALPASIPIHALSGERSFLKTRRRRRTAIDLLDSDSSWSKPETGSNLMSTLRDALQSAEPDRKEKTVHQGELALAKKLLFAVAGIDKSVMKELSDALKDEQDGHVRGIVDQINRELGVRLNFPTKWAQDREFNLTVAPNEYDLLFTISDRTRTHYTFAERSFGLRYFLSYYVQFLSHSPAEGGRSEILLMDEPDAYLSSQGQQDLLRLFDDFAATPNTSRQVVFVTHSPFLIDRNHGERIRVLEKGSRDEGTRVVKDASRNHYEPLRSAFGTYVGESAFIGNANLFVEGLSDQILLVAASSYLRSIGSAATETLDLNQVTIAPASGAQNLAYLVYLARGRDVEQPALVVLHDDDEAGRSAAAEIRRGPRGKPILSDKFIISVTQAFKATGDQGIEPEIVVREPEDLIPLPLAAAAVTAYANLFLAQDGAVLNVTSGDISSHLGDEGRLFAAITSALQTKVGTATAGISKVGFAREIASLLEKVRRGEAIDGCSPADFDQFARNFRSLFVTVSDALLQAIGERKRISVGTLVERAKNSFLRDHVGAAKREDGRNLILQLEQVLDDSLEADIVRQELGRLRRDFNLEVDLAAPISEFAEFRQQLNRIRYAGVLATQELDPTKLGEVEPEDGTAGGRPTGL